MYERHVFYELQPNEGEETCMFVTRLREQAELCDFGDASDEMIRDRVVHQTKDRKLREKFLNKKNLTLLNLLDIAKRHEATKRQLNDMMHDTSVKT